MEFLIFNASLHPEVEQDAIMDVRPDGFLWGTSEIAHPNFRIMRVPDEDLESNDVEVLREIYIGPLRDPDDDHNDIAHYKCKMRPGRIDRDERLGDSGRRRRTRRHRSVRMTRVDQ